MLISSMNRVIGFLNAAWRYGGEEALAVQEHISDSCARMASAMGERIEIGHRLERRSFWDIAVRDTVNTPPAEMVKLLLISVLALIFGFLMGRWL